VKTPISRGVCFQYNRAWFQTARPPIRSSGGTVHDVVLWFLRDSVELEAPAFAWAGGSTVHSAAKNA